MQMELLSMLGSDRLPKEQQAIWKSFKRFVRANLRAHMDSLDYAE
jgi:hypothetical protein